MTDMIKGYWYARPNITLTYSPQGDTWWVEVINGNDKEYVGDWIEDVDNSKYAHNGFLYKRMWGANYDDEREAFQVVRTLSRVFKEMEDKDYLILSKREAND